MRPSHLIDPAARLRLERAVAEAERGTDGEIVVVIVHACDEYGSVGLRLGVALAALVFLAVMLFGPPLAPWQLLAAQAIALALGHGLARIEAIRRALLPEELVEARVLERARRAFAEHGLARTRGRTGVLLLVALLERRVVVLADEAIHRALGPGERWDDVVALAVEGLRSGRPVEGLEAAVRRLGEILARHRPPETPPRDEIRTAVVVED